MGIGGGVLELLSYPGSTKIKKHVLVGRMSNSMGFLRSGKKNLMDKNKNMYHKKKRHEYDVMHR
jgi:hypothetical protein